MPLTLLAVTGMTPQVITETLYGLHRQGSPWPDKLHIMTTQIGLGIVEQSLLEGHKLDALCDELDMPRYRRDQVQIDVVPDAEGRPVDDARTIEDHEALADFIMQTVRELTADESTQVHASIAGGRKTMTFYLGYAMSLFGRPDDGMSHVLIGGGYENHPAFYFPTRTSQMIETREGRVLDMADADVNLADIPFIRHRDQLPNILLRHGAAKDERMSFRQLVELINLGGQPHRLSIRLHSRHKTLDILADGKKLHALTFSSLFDWCWFEVVAKATQESDGSLRREETKIIGKAVMSRMAKYLELPFDGKQELKQQVDQWLKQHESMLEEAGIRIADFKASMRLGLDVSQVTNRIRRRLTEELPKGVEERLAPRLYFNDKGVWTPKSNKRGGYGLNLAPEKISFCDQ